MKLQISYDAKTDTLDIGNPAAERYDLADNLTTPLPDTAP